MQAQAGNALKSVQSSGSTDGIGNVRSIASKHNSRSSSSSTISVCFEEDSLDLREEARWYEAMIEEVDDEDVGGRYVYR